NCRKWTCLSSPEDPRKFPFGTASLQVGRALVPTRSRSARLRDTFSHSTAPSPRGRLVCDSRGDERSRMGIMNRRNAFLGWTVWQVGKRTAKKKAKSVLPSVDTETRRPNKPAIIAGLATLGGVLMFWRKKTSDDGITPDG